MQSKKLPNSSEWLLLKSVFLLIVSLWGHPTLDCFASRTMKQMNRYMSLSPTRSVWPERDVAGLVDGISLPFPSIMTNRISSSKTMHSKGVTGNPGGSNLARSNLVSGDHGTMHRHSMHPPNSEKHPSKPLKPVPPSGDRGAFDFGVLLSNRYRRIGPSILPKAAELVKNASRTGTFITYTSPRKN